MSKQALGARKLQRCREIGGVPYQSAYVRGGWGHAWAECWHPATDPEHASRDADWVNYRTGEVVPRFRDGRFAPAGMRTAEDAAVASFVAAIGEADR